MPEYSADLQNNVLGPLDIQPTMSGGFNADLQDLPVFTGWEDRPTSGIWGTIRKETPGGGMGRNMKKMPKPGKKLSSQMETEFYSMDKKERAHLQKRLHAGGFYGNTDPNAIVLGIPDETSFKAYSTAVGRAAAYYASGQYKTLDDVLDEAAGIQDQIEAAGGGRGGGSGNGSVRAPLTVNLTNPDDLRRIAQRTATSTLGRALTKDETERFIASFQGMQRTQQTASYGTDESGGTVTAPPAADTAAATFARQADPTAAGGNDFLRVFQAFGRIVGKE